MSDGDNEVPRAAELNLGHWLRAARRLHSTLRDLEGNVTFTPTQFAVMLAVCQVPGTDQRTVAMLSSIDQSTVSQTLGRLARDGHVMLEPDPNDARRIRAVPARDVRQIVEADLRGVRRADELILAPLDAGERVALIDGLRAIAYEVSDDPAQVHTWEEAGGHGLLTVDETSRAFGRLARICGQRYRALWAERAGSLLTPQQFSALSLLDQRGQVRQRYMPGALCLDKVTVTGVLRRLASRNLVSVEPDSNDRRQRVVILSSYGRDIVKVVRLAVNDIESAFTRPARPVEVATLLHEVVVGGALR